MGNRATFVIEQNETDAPIFIYGHRAGYQMMDTLAAALDHAKDRIDIGDPGYATRMIFSHMVGDNWASEYGWGLSTSFLDSEHSVPVVNMTDKTVRLVPYTQWGEPFDINADPKFVMGIDAFIGKFTKTNKVA